MEAHSWIVTSYALKIIAVVWFVAESGLAVREAVKAEEARFWWPFWISLWGVVFLAAVAADLWIFTARA